MSHFYPPILLLDVKESGAMIRTPLAALSIGIFFPNQIGVLYHVAQNPQD